MKGILKGAIFAFAVTFAVILILSVITYFTNADSKMITVGVYAGVVAGVTLGSLIAAKKCEKMVLVHAMAVSAIYLAVLVLISVILNKGFQLNGHFLTMTAGILGSGFLGAVLGK